LSNHTLAFWVKWSNGLRRRTVVQSTRDIYNWNERWYREDNGTSFSSPIVAGCCALLLDAFPELTPAEMCKSIEITAVDLGTAGKDNNYGSGKIDIYKAYDSIHRIPLSSGWQTISFNVAPIDTELYASIMTDRLAANNFDQIKTLDVNEVYPDSGDFQMDLLGAFKIKMDASDVFYAIGNRRIPSDTTISLPVDWSLVAYTPNEDINAVTALSSLVPADDDTSLIMAKDGDGNFYSPEWGYNGIGDMTPGEGYEMNLDFADDLIYDEGEVASIASFDHIIEPKLSSNLSHFSKIFPTDYFYPVLIQSINLEGESPQIGDEIAIFEGNVCIGSSAWENIPIIGISAWRDDPTTNRKDGFTGSSDFWAYKYWDESRQEELLISERNVIASINKSSHSDVFGVISLDFGSDRVHIPFDWNICSNFPNPFNSTTLINYSLKDIGQVEISIFDSEGRLINILENVSKDAGEYSVLWDGSDYSCKQVPSGIYICQMNVLEGGNVIFNSSIKMVLIR